MNKKAALAALLSAGLVIGIPTIAGAATSADDKIKATLSGDNEVPGPGDPDGKGKFKATLGEDTLCYTLSVKKVDDATAAHIHAGGSDVAGPVVVTLQTPQNKQPVSECLTAVPDEEDTEATLSVSELAAIAADPGAYYVNVHSVEFPAGAVRGQLK
jgi:hypothetical protein